MYVYYEADKGNEGEPAPTGTTEAKEPTFTQADIDRIITERLERERKKSEEKTKRATEEAQAKALEEQQKFQELAQQRGTKVAELEALSTELSTKLEATDATAKRYQKALNTILAEQLKRVPDHLTGLLNRLDPVEQLEWLAQNGEKLTAPSGVPATPRPQNGMSAAEKEKASAAASRQVRSKF